MPAVAVKGALSHQPFLFVAIPRHQTRFPILAKVVADPRKLLREPTILSIMPHVLISFLFIPIIFLVCFRKNHYASIKC